MPLSRFRSIVLLASLGGPLAHPLHAQDEVAPAEEIRIALQPISEVALGDLLFGPLRYGRVLGARSGPGSARALELKVPLGDREARLVQDGEKLRIEDPLQSRQRRPLAKATRLTLGADEHQVPVQAVRFESLSSELRADGGPRSKARDNARRSHWLVYRLDGMQGVFRGIPITLLDANLDGRFTERGTDLVLVGDAKTPLRIAPVLRIAGELFELRDGDRTDELVLAPCTEATATLDPFAAIDFLPEPEWVIVRRTDGSEFRLDRGQPAVELPTGKYHLRQALFAADLEALGPATDPTAVARGPRGAGTTAAWIELEAGANHAPAWGAPLRLHPLGAGFRDPENSNSSSSASSGSQRIFHIDRILVRGGAGEIYDAVQAGPEARLGGLCSFAAARYTINTIRHDDKLDKPERWRFDRQGSYTSRTTVSQKTRAMLLEVKIAPLGKLRQEVPLD